MMKCSVAACKDYADLEVIVAGTTHRLPLCKACWITANELLQAHDQKIYDLARGTVAVLIKLKGDPS